MCIFTNFNVTLKILTNHHINVTLVERKASPARPIASMAANKTKCLSISVFGIFVNMY